MAVECERLFEVEPVGEDQPLGLGVDAQLLVVRERLFAPDEGIARVVAQAVEELGEVEVEVGEKGVHADHVGERDDVGEQILGRPRGPDGDDQEVSHADHDAGDPTKASVGRSATTY